MGHLSVGLHEKVPGVRYITCLREPVSRIVSLYHHAKNDPSHYLHGPIGSGDLTISEYVSSALSGELSDGMTRMIAGGVDFHDGVVDAGVLEKAKENIRNHFDGVVLGEKFDECLLEIAPRMGWSTPYYIRKKVGRYDRGKVMIGPAEREAILSRNRWDQALYEWVLARISRGAPAGLAEFRRRNRRFGPAVYVAREIRRRVLGL